MYNDFFELQFCFYSAFPNIVLLIVILNLHFAPYVNKVSKQTLLLVLYCVDDTYHHHHHHPLIRLSRADTV